MSRNRPFGDIAEGPFFVYYMTINDIHRGDITEMDYLELLDFVAYDIEAARKLIEEMREKDERVEKMESKPVRKERGGLRCPCCSCCTWIDLGSVILVVM